MPGFFPGDAASLSMDEARVIGECHVSCDDQHYHEYDDDCHHDVLAADRRSPIHGHHVPGDTPHVTGDHPGTGKDRRRTAGNQDVTKDGRHLATN